MMTLRIFEFELIRYFSIESPVSESEFKKLSEMEITGKVYKAAYAYYIEKMNVRLVKHFRLSKMCMKILKIDMREL